MSLATGSLLSHYEIVSRLGAGGMGEVYKAYDRTLGRHVAIKILLAGGASTDEALRRFSREAKAASSLNHPGIVTVYEIGRAVCEPDGAEIEYIAMELIEGSTLRALIERNLDPATALDYVIQTADALAKAHAAGLLHRDLKPENIMVTSDGFAKILDFGLAKSAEAPVDGDAATAVHSDAITREGIVVGTIGYMSPEQVRGVPLDSRSDIFSLGCILYECVTRRQPFRGTTAVDTLHRIAYEPPPSLEDVQPLVSPDLQRVIRKALAKDPEARYQSAKELAIDLRDIRNEQTSRSRVDRESRPNRPSRKRTGMALAAGLALLLLIASAAYWLASRNIRSDQRRIDSMSIERLPESNNARAAAISPDGRYIAEIDDTSKGQVVSVRQMATGSRITVVPADGQPFNDLQFSADGSYVQFAHEHKLQQVPVLGGAVKTLLDRHGLISFSPDGKRLAFVRDGSLYVAAADGSGERRVAGGTAREFYVQPTWSPRGDLIACTRRSVISTLAMWIEIIDPSSRDPLAGSAANPKVVGGRDWFLLMYPRWLPDGSGIIVTASKRISAERQLWRIGYPDGEAHRITNDLFSYDGVSLSADGAQLVSIQVYKRSRIWSANLSDPDKPTLVLDGVAMVNTVSILPPDRLLYSAANSGNLDLWSTRMDGSDTRRLTEDPHDDSNAAVSRDGRTIAFVSDRSGHFDLWTMSADGSNQKQLTHGGWNQSPTFSPDGQWIVYTSRGQGKWSLWKIPSGGGTARLLSSVLVRIPEYAPDGRTIAASDQAWTAGLLSPDDGKVLRTFGVKSDAGMRWSPDSKTLYYQENNALYRLAVAGSSPAKILDFTPDDLTGFDITRDGKSLVYTRTSLQRSIVVLRNFR